jgi:hypothetical protein
LTGPRPSRSRCRGVLRRCGLSRRWVPGLALRIRTLQQPIKTHVMWQCRQGLRAPSPCGARLCCANHSPSSGHDAAPLPLQSEGREFISCHDCQSAVCKWECQSGPTGTASQCRKTYCLK